MQFTVVHRFKHIYLTAAQQRRYNLERRVLGGGAYKCDYTLLHGAKQRVLLRLIEAVNLVDKQKGGARIEEVFALRLLDNLPHVLDARRNGRERVERSIESRSHDVCKRGLAHTRRSPEYERRHAARCYELAKDATLAHKVRLTDIVVETSGAQTLG